MIIPIFGKVAYQITLDPTVWIFDDRKILLEDAFSPGGQKKNEQDPSKMTAKRFERDFAQIEDKDFFANHVSKSREKDVLQNSYVMPIAEFLDNAEIEKDAVKALLITDNDEITLTLDELYNSYFLFALNGRAIGEDGPVHVLFKDGSNKDDPIKGVKKIKIV